MSTRSTTHFSYGDESFAIVYRHPDGYPEGHGTDLYKFLNDVKKQTEDTRFNDPSYLAAKLVVWLADQFAQKPLTHDEAWECGQHVADAWENAKPISWDKDRRYVKINDLDFISVGIVLEDPGDIEYRYKVDSGNLDKNGFPEITCTNIYSESTEYIPKPE